ncbi:DNA circularization protein [Castellaniella caeni]|uniref:DNA circularization protein n=1 Tax=Castellaniella caeni TaxID=266123 RepID=UPI000C9FFBA9|nr:DNA circularization N-terminal domain-containing protein [Castellaniella caeni]
MSWLLTLQDASFKGRTFEVVSTDDSVSRDVAQYERPYVDGADTEDLGRKAREFQIQAVFYGLFYEDALNTFLAVLEEPGAGELVHPIWGSIPAAQLLSYRVHHDADTPDHATVDLAFVEHQDSDPFYSSAGGTLDDLMSAYDMASAMTETVSAWAAFVGALVGSVVGGAFGLIARVTGLGGLAGGVVGQLRGVFAGASSSASDYTQAPQAFGADVQAAVGGLSDDRTYESLDDWRGMTADADAVLQIPADLVAGDSQAVSDDPDGALPATLVLGTQDVARVETVLQVAVAADVVETAIQILAAQRDNPTMTPAEIEGIVTDTRRYIVAAIDKNRAAWGVVDARPMTEPLKSAAKKIQDLGLAVINMRPPLITRRTANASNFHLLAHIWYGDFSRAAELARLNPQIRNPNDIPAGEPLNAYAQ